MIPVILASDSPRRKEILNQLGIPFTCISPQVDEKIDTISGDLAVKELSLRKANAAKEQLLANQVDLTDTLIIAADTAVVSDMEILGKPQSPRSAKAMLSSLSDNTHFVTTGITLIWNDQVITKRDLTRIAMDVIPQEEMDAYIATKIPFDKAGAYGIQDFAAMWIQGIQGDYYNVVGFPVHLFYTMLQQLNLTILPGKGIVAYQ